MPQEYGPVAEFAAARRRHKEHPRIERGTVMPVPDEPARSSKRVLEPGENEAVIPLAIDVNRCDPHAVAETTRKFGIDLYVSVDGSESRLINVPIDSIADDLEAMLERCKTRTGQ